MVNVTQITPYFPPQIDGLGDYSHLLARHLRDDHQIESRFLIGDPSWHPGESPPDFATQPLARRSASALGDSLQASSLVVLHYVGYGYQSRGVPCWLVKGLRRWKVAQSSRRLVIVFHELWSSGPPWRSEFYLGALQRRLTVQLHRLCDAAMTSTPLMTRMLDGISPGKTIFQPIANSLPAVPFSKRTPHTHRPVRVVVFGLQATRLRSIRAHAKLLQALHAEGLLAGVEAVGQKACADAIPSEDVGLLRTLVPASMVTATGNVSPEEGAHRLAQADLFLSAYPSALLCKSSALTAALACGCVPVIPEANHASPLAENRELLACDGSREAITQLISVIRSGTLPEIAEAGWNWRNHHASWEETAKHVARMLVESDSTRQKKLQS